MPVTVVVGGQFGSEGKGKIAEWLARERRSKFAVRVGGPNSGHTVVDPAGKTRVFRQLPTAALLDDVVCVVGAGAYIDLAVLADEIAETRITRDRLIVHPRAIVIEESDKEYERGDLAGRIASTGSGTGSAVRRRTERKTGIRFAEDVSALRHFVRDASLELSSASRNESIIVEGTQGFGLSVLYGAYPYVTSRDTTAAAFLSEAGLSPMLVEDVAMVIRCHPIRVGGDSGPLPGEINWHVLSKESALASPILERTTVTRSVRRVARFDADVVRRAIAHNSPTIVILNHLDYIVESERSHFVRRVEGMIDRRVDFVGFGPGITVARSAVLEVV